MASLAMAFRLSPPLISERRAPGTAAMTAATVRAMSCTAFPRSSWMHRPTHKALQTQLRWIERDEGGGVEGWCVKKVRA